MRKWLKNNIGTRSPSGTQGGFIELIILIIIALFVMKYYGITVTGVIDWFVSFFRNVLR